MKKSAFWLLLLLLLPNVAFAAPVFNRNLYFGLRGDSDVVKMQDFLRSLNIFTYPVSTGNYFTQTYKAVRDFQLQNNISPASGFFGPLTRAAVNQKIEDMGSSNVFSAPVYTSSSPSSYKGKIVIGSANSNVDDPRHETIYLENRSDKENISITGFRIENSKGNSFIIPRAYALPGFGTTLAATDLVVLRPGGRAIISTGKQERNMDFQTNMCTGYFAETSEFIPSINSSCPTIDTKGLTQLSDACIQLIESTPSCQSPDYTATTENDCSEFMANHLNYAGCVRDNKNKEGFYSGEWYIWMQRDTNFLRQIRETLILRDYQGKEVDTYSY